MLVLDTNHLVEIDLASDLGAGLRSRLITADADIATTIISVEEQLRGWLAQVRRLNDPHRQIEAYRRLEGRLDFFAKWNVLSWDDAAADIYTNLRAQRIRIGTMDLKIASIVLAQDAVLLSRNLRDFNQVPNLRVEDWL